jgi:hypothetical protein
MPIYVDDIGIPWKKTLWYHLMALPRNDEELHEFAASIGLKQSWFQRESRPHYDVTKSKRELAIAAGAIAVSWRELITRAQEAERVQ